MSEKTSAPSRSEIEQALSTLLRAAETDASLRRQLLTLAGLPAVQRRTLVDNAVRQMELKREPAVFRAAFTLLATDTGAEVTRRALG